MLTETCNWGLASCACGATVRAGRDVFTLSHCGGDHIIEFLRYDDGILDVRQISTNYYAVSICALNYFEITTYLRTV